MFARIKNSGRYEYLQIVENRWEDKKSRQHVIARLGRLDRMQDKGEVERLIHSLSRYCEKAMLILCSKSNLNPVR